jgi:hypothetical protein
MPESRNDKWAVPNARGLLDWTTNPSGQAQIEIRQLETWPVLGRADRLSKGHARAEEGAQRIAKANECFEASRSILSRQRPRREQHAHNV